MAKRPNSMETGQHRTRLRLVVAPAKGGWTVLSDQSEQRSRKVYKTKGDARAAAREMTGRDGGEVIVKGRDGRIGEVDTFSLGRAEIAKISAIEGLHITSEMDADLRELDQKNLTDEQRRQKLFLKYARAPIPHEDV